MKKVIVLLLVILGISSIFVFKSSFYKNNISKKTLENIQDKGGEIVAQVHPLSIEALRKGEYPGSDITIEQELDPGSDYVRYIASYKSEGLKIYGLLTIPTTQKPSTGWPIIIFNHGYIAPSEYRTTERYVAYQDAFARNGYITFKSDYRGHGNSEGVARGGYGNNDYTIDVLNALASVKRLHDPRNPSLLIADPNRVGFWGHSMGGFITLRSMVVRKDIKAGVIWAGVVADYPELINNWRRRISPSQPIPSLARRWRDILTQEYGEPNNNDPLWKSISANNYLSDISGPVQLHHGTADTSVPVEFSQQLENQLKSAGKTVEYYEYPGDDHNLTANFNTAIQRSLDFFDTYVKNN